MLTSISCLEDAFWNFPYIHSFSRANLLKLPLEMVTDCVNLVYLHLLNWSIFVGESGCKILNIRVRCMKVLSFSDSNFAEVNQYVFRKGKKTAQIENKETETDGFLKSLESLNFQPTFCRKKLYNNLRNSLSSKSDEHLIRSDSF